MLSRCCTRNYSHRVEVIVSTSVHAFTDASSVRLCSSYHTSRDYQYLQECSLDTDYFQNSLPTLPVPKLYNTLQRYLDAQKAVVRDQLEYERIKMLAQMFESDSVSGLLQNRLMRKARADKNTSYISSFWFEMYLANRQPVVINSNPFMSFVDSSLDETQLSRAANIVISALRFKRSLDANCLAPEVYHAKPLSARDSQRMHRLLHYLPSAMKCYGAYLYNAYPLDMSQFSSLFSTVRVPQSGMDRLHRFTDSRHILVLRNGRLFTLRCYDAADNILTPRLIHGALKYIAQQSSGSADTSAQNVGYLVADDRDSWSAARRHLMHANDTVLYDIDSALFVLCLDTESIGSDGERLFRQFLHGPPGNRWYDKSLSVIVTADAKAAVNFEHSWGDGVAVLRFFNEVHKDCGAHSFVARSGADNSGSWDEDCEHLVSELQWVIDSSVKNLIDKAKSRFAARFSQLDVAIVQNSSLGKRLAKIGRVSPDAVMQMAFQVAYHRLTGGEVTATYESCSTSAFKHGRTETIRPATEHTRRLSEALNCGPDRTGSRDRQELLEMVRACSRRHTQLTIEAAKGQGCDRHLFALRKMAESLMEVEKVPDMFTDRTFERFNKFRISTSTLSSPYFEAGGFGPVEADGFGIGYSIGDEQCGCMISGYGDKVDVSRFGRCLNEVFDELSQILAK